MAKKTLSEYTGVSDSFKMVVMPKNEQQKLLMKTIAENVITFVKGMPGSGKTFMATTFGLQQLLRDKYERLVFTRPTVEAAGEKLGFLPGTMYEKINPYMIPIFDSLLQLIPVDLFNKLTAKNGSAPRIQVLPLAFMRGVTFQNCFVLCDESQNASPEQMRMLLTRLGEGTKMVVCGDVKQSDIPGRNGLEDAFDILQDIENVGFVTLTEEAIVRHPLVGIIDKRYDEKAKKRTSASKKTV